MAQAGRWKRIGLGIGAVLVLAVGVVGYQAYRVIGPALGWVAPVVDTVPPELPASVFDADFAILLFSKTSGFRHTDAIPAARASVERIAAERGWTVFATENAAVFNDEQLAHFALVFGNNTTGDNWSPPQRDAFIAYLEGGGGFVGVHGSAGTRFRYWDWYTDVLHGGGRFIGHPTSPQFQEATVVIEDPEFPAMAPFGQRFTHTDEWYSFEESARKAGSHVLATLDEGTYTPGDDWAMGEDHPIIWLACVGQGRSFYSALGHTAETYARPDHEQMLAEAMAWAGDREAACP